MPYPFVPADGEKARWRRVDEYIDQTKEPGELITFQEIERLLGVDRQAAIGVINEVRKKRERASKRTLVSRRGAGWLLARADQELEEDDRRQEHLLAAARSRVQLLESVQARRDELNDEDRRSLDFRHSQAATQAFVLGDKKASSAEIMGMLSTSPSLPAVQRNRKNNGN